MAHGSSFNLADLFEMVADQVPRRLAVVCGAARLDYAELEARSNRLAHYLQRRGVGPGDHVGLFMYNCTEYLEAMLACFKLRAVPINVNYRYVREELVYLFRNADIVACVHHREFAPAIADVLDNIGELLVFIAVDDASGAELARIGAGNYESVLEGQSARRDFGPRSDDDLFILYTGGTTGMPKGVMWPHKAVFYAALGGGGYFHPDGPISAPEEIVGRITEHPIVNLALAPLMHGACWWSACIQLLAGNTVVLNPHHSLDGAQVWDIVEAEGVNALSIVGDAIAIPLLDALAANPGRWNLASIVNISSGGAVFSESKQQALREYFPDVFIANAFGSSESGAMGMDNGSRKAGERGLGNVTRSPFMDVIVIESGTPRHARPGEPGVFARAGHIPLGYYNDPAKTAETFVDVEGTRWLLTGDAACLEEDGSITVFGRGSNTINSGGEKIFPEEVEQALKTHPAVFDALVVGLLDERWGERVCAVIAPRGSERIGLADIQETARQHIASYKVPRELHIVAEIPRAPSGKPDYRKAREIALSNACRVE